MIATLTRAAREPSLVLGGTLTALLAAAALCSLAWTPASYRIDIPHKLAPPSWAHPFGTDALGRDVASLVLVGTQNSLLVGLVAVAVGCSLGVLLGLTAAAKGGLLDEAMMRLADVAFAFPAVLSAIVLTAAFGPGIGNAVVAIAIFNLPVFARTARASAQAVWTRDYVLAARAAGKGAVRISFEHVLPNIASPLVVQATIQFATAILAEAALSYLGLGTQPPRPSWGRMLNDAQTLMFTAPRLAIVPGAAIALSVLALNLLGDGLNDLVNPRLRRRR